MLPDKEENWKFNHEFAVLKAEPGVPLTTIEKALNEGAEGEPQVMFTALGECFVVCHIKKVKQKADLPLPRAVGIERSDT